MKKKKIPVATFTLLYKNGKNKVQEFYESLENNFSDSESDCKESSHCKENNLNNIVIQKYILTYLSDDEEKNNQKKKKNLFI